MSSVPVQQHQQRGPHRHHLPADLRADGTAGPRYGQPADMDAIVEICARDEVPLIEDAAESLGALYKGRHTGTIGRFGWSCAGELNAGGDSARGLE